ncbi:MULTISPECIES: class F sortase [unclassified Nonomuraea]|uniref:class F sortase n=1 Tax=unclassified Nonomuraea TaxID=2593643 RepID=UPI0033D74BD3
MAGQYPYGGEPPQDRGSTVLRSVLILAAVAGVVTVVAGLLIVLRSPEEYGLASQRDTLPVTVQPDGKTTGQPAQALFKAAPTAPPPLPLPDPAPAMLPSTPQRIVIKRLGINAPVESLGLAKDGTIQVPAADNPNLVGWYRNMSTPGEAGPAVMLGHKDTRTRSAVFSRLYEIRNGDTIEVKRQDRTTAVFTVGGVEQASKKTFPTQRVYGNQPNDNAQLHLITCGGTYNRSIGHYTDNIIVYATMTSSYRG